MIDELEIVREIIKQELLFYNNSNSNSNILYESEEWELNVFVLHKLLKVESLEEILQIALNSKEDLSLHVQTILQLLDAIISTEEKKKKIIIPMSHLDRCFSIYSNDFNYLKILLKYSSNTKTVVKYIFPTLSVSSIQLEALNTDQMESLIRRCGNYKLQQQQQQQQFISSRGNSSSRSSNDMDDVIQQLIIQQQQQSTTSNTSNTTFMDDLRLSRQLTQLQTLRSSSTSTSTTNARESIPIKLPQNTFSNGSSSGRLDRQLQQLKSLRI